MRVERVERAARHRAKAAPAATIAAPAETIASRLSATTRAISGGDDRRHRQEPVTALPADSLGDGLREEGRRLDLSLIQGRQPGRERAVARRLRPARFAPGDVSIDPTVRCGAELSTGDTRKVRRNLFAVHEVFFRLIGTTTSFP